MRSDRIQRQIDRLLDQCEEAIARGDWELVRTNARAVLGIDGDDRDAQAFLAAADAAITPSTATPPEQMPSVVSIETAAAPLPTSFCEGRYEVKRFLGEGGKKRVYLAHDTKLDRDVAFALIKTDGLDDEGLLRIKREAQAMGRLGDHPHIVSVHDIGDEAGQPYLVSQLMPGGDVEGLVERAEGHRLPLETALEIADQVCRALEHAHSHGVVHRDLKPGNVWLTADGTAKLGDFGLAVALDRSRLTQAGMMVGTVSYMPPEQAMGGEVTARSDLYSLGAMLYEMVTGRPPFVGDESVAIITQHLNTPPVAPSWHAPDVPPGLEALILRLLEKDPAKRPASAAEVRGMLAGVNLSPGPSPARGGEAATPEAGAPPSLAGKGDGGLGSPLYRRTFVGREQELAQLQATFDAAISGQGALVTVVGEPGIGKTALCEQLATYAAIRGGKALVGHCYEEGSLSLPYLPFVEAIRSHVLVQPAEALKEELGGGASEVARIVSEIREKVAVEPRPPGNAEDERWRLYQAVTGFLRNAASVQPLVLVLEDLHWADRGTLDFLVHLSRNLAGARLLVVGTYRDVDVDRSHPLSSALAELRRGSTFARVPLRGLTPDEVHRMLNNLTGQDVRWSLAEAVHRQTEGNPLFIQEVMRYLVEEGLITREAGRWHRAGTAAPEMSIPEGLRDVIGKRLSRLSPECNRVLTLAAVIGREFGLATLQAVAGVAEDALLDVLEEAVRVGVLQEQTRPGAVGFRFSHAFFRQTLYEELFTPRRLRLHQEVARALERQYASRLEEHAAELAEHFAQSSDPGDLGKAIHYGERAGRRAMAVYAYGEAARHLERALQVQEILDPEDLARRCDLILALGEALAPAGEPQRVFESVAEEAFVLAERLDDGARVARAAELAVEAAWRYGAARATATPLYRRWVERLAAHAAPGTALRIRADSRLAEAYVRAGRWAEGRALARAALDAAWKVGDPELILSADYARTGAQWAPRDWQEVLDVVRKSLELGREGVSRHTLARFLINAQHVLLVAGDRAGADALWRELEQLGARSQDAELLLLGLQAEGTRLLIDGHLERAVEFTERMVTRAEEMGSSVAGGAAADYIAYRCLLHLGRPEDALVHGGAIGAGARAGDRVVCLALMGRTDEARAGLASALARLEISDATATRVLGSLLEAAVLLGDTAVAERLVPLLGDATASFFPLTGVARVVAAAAGLLGDGSAARAHLEQALEWATKIRFRPEVALTRLQLAELLLEDGAQSAAMAHLDFAVEEFRAMKMQPYLERALRHKGLLRA